MIEETKWHDSLDHLVALRRGLRRAVGLPITAEVKANYLVNNGGWFRGRGISVRQRKYIFAKHLRAAESIGSKVFAVHVDKQYYEESYPGMNCREVAWDTLFQRLAKTAEADESRDLRRFHISHDEGDDMRIRRHSRRARRHLTAGQIYGTPSVTLPTGWLVDDPVSRRSQDTYFIQLADLVAWCASRTMIPPGRRSAHINPGWAQLGTARFAPVNAQAMKRNPDLQPGIVVRK